MSNHDRSYQSLCEAAALCVRKVRLRSHTQAAEFTCIFCYGGAAAA
eukprot:SAG22_NODE_3433_length_1714_cov_1.362848_1_plen_45_part_10